MIEMSLINVKIKKLFCHQVIMTPMVIYFLAQRTKLNIL
ncbi:hypothetical protein CLOSBL3_11595 [Clostridiaceae bacterium BL-3]|nr:hypothetical protein CLOSBL3_11595 [Clostridiaceae bacterium BL-3]